MALYKYPQYLGQSQEAVFDQSNHPGGHVPHSGIYRCTGCGREVVAEEARSFPPQNHHQHTAHQGPVIWRLAVYADHRAK
jgi:hypothetical protein